MPAPLLGDGKGDDRLKSLGVGDDQVGQDFAVEFDVFDFEGVDQAGVIWGAVDGGEAGVDPLDPEFSHVTLAALPTVEGVLAGVEVGLFGHREEAVTGHAHAFGAGEDFFVVFSADGTGFDSHGLNPGF